MPCSAPPPWGLSEVWRARCVHQLWASKWLVEVKSHFLRKIRSDIFMSFKAFWSPLIHNIWYRGCEIPWYFHNPWYVPDSSFYSRDTRHIPDTIPEVHTANLCYLYFDFGFLLVWPIYVYLQNGIAGECQTRYIVQDDKKNNGLLITRIKDLNNCRKKIVQRVGMSYIDFIPNCPLVRML